MITSRLIRSLPQSFAPISIVASFFDSFEKVGQDVCAEVDRGKYPHNSQARNFISETQAKLYANYSEKKGNHAAGKPNIFQSESGRRKEAACTATREAITDSN